MIHIGICVDEPASEQSEPYDRTGCWSLLFCPQQAGQRQMSEQ